MGPRRSERCRRERIAPLLILAALALVGCGGEPAPPLRIGTLVWPGYEPLYLARDLGYFEDRSVRLVEYPSNTEVSRAFRNRAIDGAALTLDEAISLAEGGFGLRVVLVMDISHGGDVILGRSEMRTVRDLVGRRVAVDTGTVASYVLARALALNGLKASDLKIVHVDYSEHAAAFRAGRVDAIVNAEPLRSELLASGASLLFDSTAIPGEIVDILAIRSDYLEAHGANVTGLLRAWFRATDYLGRNPNDAAARMAVREQITAERFLKSLEGLRIPGHAENLKLFGGPDPALVQTARRLMEVMLTERLLRAPTDVDALLAPAPLQALAR
ncbi:MAG: ABC transporter substrate-binding protein [Pseudomonadota bacterium]|nr:ABC transporter substrate-binding protein [Gammaproteobacteria bacterium]MDQ3582891.1 ABC transporter substrate-binding protein [Pseudomonadota bacterium]